MPWRRERLPTPLFLGFPCGSDGKESACNAGNLGLIHGFRRSPGRRGSTLGLLPTESQGQGAWEAVIHRVKQSRTWLKRLSSISSSRVGSVSCYFQVYITVIQLHTHTRMYSESEVAWSCPTLRDPMDCSLPGSSVHGIFQARVLEWASISFSRRSSQPRDWT